MGYSMIIVTPDVDRLCEPGYEDFAIFTDDVDEIAVHTPQSITGKYTKVDGSIVIVSAVEIVDQEIRFRLHGRSLVLWFENAFEPAYPREIWEKYGHYHRPITDVHIINK